MTFRQFLAVIVLATVFLWIGWGWTVSVINPYKTNWLGFLLFGITFFLALVGTFSLAGIWIRMKWVHDQARHRLVMLSVRQGVALSIFLSFLLFLQSQRVLRWWIVLLMLIVVFGLEYLTLTRERKAVSKSKQRSKKDESPSPQFASKQVASQQQENFSDRPTFEKKSLEE